MSTVLQYYEIVLIGPFGRADTLEGIHFGT